MAINLKDFEEEVERGLPIIVLVDESGAGSEVGEVKWKSKYYQGRYDSNYGYKGSEHGYNTIFISHQVYMADFVRKLYEELCRCNIRGKLSVVSYGDKISFRYPILQEDQSPCFCPVEDINQEELVQAILDMKTSKTAVLGTALSLSKAMMEDADTLDSHNYEPVIVILSAGCPSPGWQDAYAKLTADGHGGKSQVFLVNMGERQVSQENMAETFSCRMNNGRYIILSKDANYASESHFGIRNYKNVGSNKYIGDALEKIWETMGLDFYNISGQEKKDDAVVKRKKEMTEKLDKWRQEMEAGKVNTIANVMGSEFGMAEIRPVEGSDKADEVTEEGKSPSETHMHKVRPDEFIFDDRSEEEKYNGGEIVKELVSKIQFLPMEETPEEVELEKPQVSIPKGQAGHGDNPNANGEGYI